MPGPRSTGLRQPRLCAEIPTRTRVVIFNLLCFVLCIPPPPPQGLKVKVFSQNPESRRLRAQGKEAQLPSRSERGSLGKGLRSAAMLALSFRLRVRGRPETGCKGIKRCRDELTFEKRVPDQNGHCLGRRGGRDGGLPSPALCPQLHRPNSWLRATAAGGATPLPFVGVSL